MKEETNRKLGREQENDGMTGKKSRQKGRKTKRSKG